MESSLFELVCTSDSCKWLGGARGRGKRQFDQKEGRRDQPPLTAASMLIKISLCMQSDSARGGCWFNANPETKPWQRAVWSGGKWLSAFFRLFGKARAVSQGALDTWVLSQHLRGSASCFLPLVSLPRQNPDQNRGQTAACWLRFAEGEPFSLPAGRLPAWHLPLDTQRERASQWVTVKLWPLPSWCCFQESQLHLLPDRQFPTAQTLQSELS